MSLQDDVIEKKGMSAFASILKLLCIYVFFFSFHFIFILFFLRFKKVNSKVAVSLYCHMRAKQVCTQYKIL